MSDTYKVQVVPELDRKKLEDSLKKYRPQTPVKIKIDQTDIQRQISAAIKSVGPVEIPPLRIPISADTSRLSAEIQKISRSSVVLDNLSVPANRSSAPAASPAVQTASPAAAIPVTVVQTPQAQQASESSSHPVIEKMQGFKDTINGVQQQFDALKSFRKKLESQQQNLARRKALKICPDFKLG